MKKISDVWIGADPGGKKNFGLAILAPNGSAQTWCVDCADEAVDLVRANITNLPDGVGVDAPLWWSSGPSGDRLADQWLRKTYKLSGGQVQASNSLRGAALIQGMMFVQGLRSLFPTVPVTESHPNAVLKSLHLSGPTFCETFRVTLNGSTKHELDALISAVAAREGFSGRWPRDLSETRQPCEQDTKQFWLAPIHYYWPE